MHPRTAKEWIKFPSLVRAIIFSKGKNQDEAFFSFLMPDFFLEKKVILGNKNFANIEGLVFI